MELKLINENFSLTSLGLKMNEKPGLRIIVMYERFIGNTYFGWNFGKKLSKRMKISLIFWNIITFSLVSIQCYIGLNGAFSSTPSQLDLIKYTPDLTKYNSFLPRLLFNVGYISYSVQTLIIASFLAIRGRNMLNVLNRTDIIRVDPYIERKVGLILVSIKFVFTFLFVIITACFMFKLYGSFDLKVTLLFLVFLPIVYFLLFNIKFTIITIILYKSLMVCQQLKTVSQIKDIKLIFDIICRIRESIENLDSILCSINLMILSFDSLVTVSAICMLAYVPDENPLNSLCHLLSSLSIILTLCLVCDVIPKRYVQLLKDLKNEFRDRNENKSSSEQQLNHILMIRLNEMKDEMCFTAFNLFKLNANTLLSCLALIISYSIIIIQTTNQSTDCPKT